MPYYKNLSSCLCLHNFKPSGGSVQGSGNFFSAKLSGSINVASSFEPYPASGILHTLTEKCTEFSPLHSVQDLSPAVEPKTKYRVFVDTRNFSFAPVPGDSFIAASGDETHRYMITSVTTA